MQPPGFRNDWTTGLLAVLRAAAVVALIAIPTVAIPVADAAPAIDGAEVIFADAFDSGNTLAWSARQPPLPVPDAYRAGDLDLRDPHVFVDLPGFGCFDFTDTELPLGLGPSFNGQLATSIAGDENGDGLLDLSLLFAFRPFAAAAADERLDQGMGECTAPLATTACDWQIPPVPFTTAYDGIAAAACAGAIAGTTSGYLPAPAQPLAPCVVSDARQLPVELLGTRVDLQDTRLSAEIAAVVDLGGGFGQVLEDGLLFGFLSEADADSILLPPELPLVGGEPLSILLPGGTGNCAAGDDRDVHLGQPGWWFYFDLAAAPVPFVGP